jgi:hypothetical protein
MGRIGKDLIELETKKLKKETFQSSAKAEVDNRIATKEEIEDTYVNLNAENQSINS